MKEGVASDPSSHDKFLELLRFPSTQTEGDGLTSLKTYTERMKDDQKEIYYLLGDSLEVARRSAHLEYFRKHDLEVLYLTDPVDNFMLMGLNEYDSTSHSKTSTTPTWTCPKTTNPKSKRPKDEKFISLTAFVKQVLGERVEDVRESKLLSEGAARLSNPAGGSSSFYRAQRLMGQDAQVPKKISGTQPQKRAGAKAERTPHRQRQRPAAPRFSRATF